MVEESMEKLEQTDRKRTQNRREKRKPEDQPGRYNSWLIGIPGKNRESRGK